MRETEQQHTAGSAELQPPAGVLAGIAAPGPLVAFCGVEVVRDFGEGREELQALVQGAGMFDLSWLQRVTITGEDRLRWLNGMVTNSVRDLQPGSSCFSFLLSAQGRIQGDADIFAEPNRLLLSTDRAQAPAVLAHLERFIIMDDVELRPEPEIAAIGLGGPQVPELLERAGLPIPGLQRFSSAGPVMVAQPRPGSYVLWLDAAAAGQWGLRLAEAGARPCGVDAVESARVRAGVPRYGADIGDRSLPQETGQMRALHFSKGCYLGQEIVERVRSRGAVHRSLRCLRLRGTVPQAGTMLYAEGKADPVGEVSSVAGVSLPGDDGIYALGTVRNEAAQSALRFDGGTAEVLMQPPEANQ